MLSNFPVVDHNFASYAEAVALPILQIKDNTVVVLLIIFEDLQGAVERVGNDVEISVIIKVDIGEGGAMLIGIQTMLRTETGSFCTPMNLRPTISSLRLAC